MSFKSDSSPAGPSIQPSEEVGEVAERETPPLILEPLDQATPSLEPEPLDPEASAESKVRRRLKPKPTISFGLEEETDFTSEDLISERGEIVQENPGWIPPAPRPTVDPADEIRRKLTLSKKEKKAFDKEKKAQEKEERARQKAEKSQDKLLAQSRLVPPEEWEMRSMASSDSSLGRGASTTSLASIGLRRGSFLGGWKFGKGRNEQSLGTLPAWESEESFGSASKSVSSSRRASYILERPQASALRIASRRPSLTSLAPIDTSPFTYSPQIQTPEQHGAPSMTTVSSAASDSTLRTASIGPSLHLTMMSQSETNSTFQSILSVAHSYKEPVLHHSSSPPPPGSRKAFTSPTIIAPQSVEKIDDPLGLLGSLNSATEAREHGADRVPSERTDQSYFPMALLPAFPVSDPDRLTSIAILSTTIWKRVSTALPAPEKSKGGNRPGTASSAIGFGFGKASMSPPVWTYYRMVLTHFKMHDVMTAQSIRGPPKHHRQLSTQTVAHLHLFAMQSYPSNIPSRPSTSSSIPQFGSVNKKRPGTSQGLQSTLEKTESERRMIDGAITVGIWDEATGADLKRKNVLRIGFGSEQTGEQTWYCSFADTPVMDEWLKQIKAFAVIARAEGAGLGSAIRETHATGRTPDLDFEFEMQARGLRSVPSSGSSQLPSIGSHHSAAFSPAIVESPIPDDPDRFREKMMAKGHTFDSPSAQLPMTMLDVFNQSVPSGDLTQIAHVDYEHRLMQAEELRRNEMHKHHPAAIAKATQAAVSKMSRQDQEAIEKGMKGLGIGPQQTGTKQTQSAREIMFSPKKDGSQISGSARETGDRHPRLLSPPKSPRRQKSWTSQPDFRKHYQSAGLPPLPTFPSFPLSDRPIAKMSASTTAQDHSDQGMEDLGRQSVVHPGQSAIKMPLTLLASHPDTKRRPSTGLEPSKGVQSQYKSSARPSTGTSQPTPLLLKPLTLRPELFVGTSPTNSDFAPSPAEEISPEAIGFSVEYDPPNEQFRSPSPPPPHAIITQPTPQTLSHAREESLTLPDGVFGLTRDTASIVESEHSDSAADSSSTASKKKMKVLTPAVDLMAEMSVRPDMNYDEVPEAIPEKKSGKGKSIRFG